ncbi:Ctr copper transporter [Melampsora americana]|nr:Ctr copper transporter [Melampsora americana]
MINESSNHNISTGQMSSTFSTSIPITPIWFQDWIPETAISTFAICLGLSILALLYKSISIIQFKLLNPSSSIHHHQHHHNHLSSNLNQSNRKSNEEFESHPLNLDDEAHHQTLINTPHLRPDSSLHSIPTSTCSSQPPHHDDHFLDYPSHPTTTLHSNSTFSHRFSLIFQKTNLLRCFLVTLQAGLGYLLMLAVMTYNIYYFIAILIGTFLGEAFFGQTNSSSTHHHA